MKADAFLNRVHGQYAHILERKIALGLLSQSPQEIKKKRAYDCLIYLPLKVTSGVVLELVHLVETIATAVIHLAGAVFAQDKKRELFKARRFFLAGMIECALRIILTPVYVVKAERDVLVNPFNFEATVRARYNYQKGIRDLESWKLGATKELTKRRIQEQIDSLKNEIPVSSLENFLIFHEVQKEKRLKLRRAQHAGDNA